MVTHLLRTYVLTRCSTRCGSTIGCRRRRSVTSGALRSCAACRSARWTSSSRSPPSRAAGKHRHVERDDRPAFGQHGQCSAGMAPGRLQPGATGGPGRRLAQPSTTPYPAASSGQSASRGPRRPARSGLLSAQVHRQPQLRLLRLRWPPAHLDRQRLPRHLRLPRGQQREPRDPAVRPGRQQQ